MKVNNLFRAPRALQAAGMILLGEGLVMAIIRSSSVFLTAAGLGFDLFVVAFLLKGSRAAWLFALIAALVGIASALLGGPPWAVGTGCAVAVCLLLPASREYTWVRRRNRLGELWSTGVAKRLSDAVVQRLLFPEEVFTWRLIGRLLALAIALFLLVGAVSLWKNGAGSGSPIVAAIYRITWIAYGLCQFALIAAVVVALVLRFSQRSSRKLDHRAG
jgi:lysylphosphatidylglycerol synthetase-like protein (DUF2156 family)